jgi:hypothetical protein
LEYQAVSIFCLDSCRQPDHCSNPRLRPTPVTSSAGTQSPPTIGLCFPTRPFRLGRTKTKRQAWKPRLRAWERALPSRNSYRANWACAAISSRSPIPAHGWLSLFHPLDDPRYTAYLETSDFKALSDAQQQNYFAARTLSLYQNRYREPSQDELTGYLAGLSFVSAAVSDETIKAEAASQAALVGGWMSANGYLLVRPNWGFAAQGAAGVGDSLEFPFGRIFSRLTGSSFAATGGFISALQNSGTWPAISTGWNAATILGIAAGTLLATLGGSFLGAVILAVLGSAAGIVAARAWVLSFDYDAFDVYAWPGNNSIGISSSHGQQTQFSAADVVSGASAQAVRTDGPLCERVKVMNPKWSKSCSAWDSKTSEELAQLIDNEGAYQLKLDFITSTNTVGTAEATNMVLLLVVGKEEEIIRASFAGQDVLIPGSVLSRPLCDPLHLGRYINILIDRFSIMPAEIL